MDTDMTVVELFVAVGQLISQYGLPLVMFGGIVWASSQGFIIWRNAHEAIVQLYKDRLQDAHTRNTELARERDKLMEIAIPTARALEHGATVLREERQASKG